MLLRINLTLFLCSLLCSCSDKSLSITERQEFAFQQDYKQLFDEIRSMLASDQQIRKLLVYGSSDSHYTDSLDDAYARQQLDLGDMLAKNELLLVSPHFRDSVTRLMIAQDEKHTLRLIAMINKYGYPESSRLDSVTNVSPFLLLHHPSNKYKDTLSKLLNTELRLKRIDSVSYGLIMWDLEGREGLPQIKGMKTHKSDNGTITIEL